MHHQLKRADGRRMPIARAVVATLLAIAVMTSAACANETTRSATGDSQTGPTDPAATTTTRPKGPLPVKSIVRTYVDTSRPTPAASQTPESPERSIETTIWYPDADGTFPLIVFSHGIVGHPDKLSHLLSTWAKAGFVVAAPAFPLTNEHAPGGMGNVPDVVHQPADVSFVIDELLKANTDDDVLKGHIDTEHVGVGGHSLGGATTYGVVFNSCCRDRRVDSVLILSGFQFPMEDGSYSFDSDLPVLVMHGDADPVLNIQGDKDIYAQLTGPKWFVTLIGGSHSPPYENDPSPHDALVEKTTTDYWLGTLAGDRAALARVPSDATSADLTSVQHAP